jgi:hypothetical protein
MACASALNADGSKRLERRPQARQFKFQKLGILDSWAVHCATRSGILKRNLLPEGDAVI